MTRIPSDRNERLEQAWVDYWFVIAMRRLDFDWDAALCRIMERAQRIIGSADWE